MSINVRDLAPVRIDAPASDVSAAAYVRTGIAGAPGATGAAGATGAQGLPGVNAVPADTAVAAYVNDTTPSATRAALLTVVAAGPEPTTALRNTDANAIYAGGAYPTRASVTTDTLRRVRWIGPVAPEISSTYATTGLDVWEATP